VVSPGDGSRASRRRARRHRRRDDAGGGAAAHDAAAAVAVDYAVRPLVVGAPGAVSHAVLDALAPLGVTHIDMPATPARVWQATQRAR